MITTFRLMLAVLAAISSTVLAQPITARKDIVLGGVRQSILIRGNERTNPVLLFLHGGPGLSQRPFAHVNRDLERDFTVVHWDQRGSGRSFRAEIPPESMRVEQLVADTLELAHWLRQRFAQRKIYLVAHSWGTVIGALAVEREPELFRAYVAIGQFVNIGDSEADLDRWAREAARRRGEWRMLRALHKIGPPPYSSHREERRVNALTKRLRPRVKNEMTTPRAIWLGITSPHYSILETPRLLRAAAFSGRRLEREIYTIDLARRVRRIDMPVWFFVGRHDTVLSPRITERYFHQLRAPRGKRLVWFERSAHQPHLEQPDDYHAELRRILRETSPAQKPAFKRTIK